MGGGRKGRGNGRGNGRGEEGGVQGNGRGRESGRGKEGGVEGRGRGSGRGKEGGVEGRGTGRGREEGVVGFNIKRAFSCTSYGIPAVLVFFAGEWSPCPVYLSCSFAFDGIRSFRLVFVSLVRRFTCTSGKGELHVALHGTSAVGFTKRLLPAVGFWRLRRKFLPVIATAVRVVPADCFDSRGHDALDAVFSRSAGGTGTGTGTTAAVLK